VTSRRVIIDTDPGIDDAQAILFALFCGQFRIDALTTVFGNCPSDVGAQNALRLVEMAGQPTIPVYLGAAEPLVRRRLPPESGARVHGKKGFGDLDLPPPRGSVQPGYAAAELARRVVEAPGEITILALGPLTNLALAIRLEPRFAPSVKEIIYMGGIVTGYGNVTAVATANVMNDSEAAKIVFNAGIPFTMVGQDVTRWSRMSTERRERLRQVGGEIAEFLYGITEYYGNYYAQIEDIAGFPVHDLLVMAYALRPELFETRFLHVDVETDGALTAGMTVADFRPSSTATPNVHVCLKADAAQIYDWYEQVIAAACRAAAQTVTGLQS
jgi:purine nucleosidase